MFPPSLHLVTAAPRPLTGLRLCPSFPSFTCFVRLRRSHQQQAAVPVGLHLSYIRCYPNDPSSFASSEPHVEPANDHSFDSDLYKAFFDNETFSDPTIQLSDRAVHVHRIVLCRRSEYFTKLLTGQFQVCLSTPMSNCDMS
jgi:hypothetical protein